MSNNNVGHNERLYRKRRQAFKARCRQEDRPCYWATSGRCIHGGAGIEYDGPPRDTRSFTVEHRTPRSLGGAKDDPENWEAAHYGCNSARGNGLTRGTGTTRTPRPYDTTPLTDPHSEAWP